MRDMDIQKMFDAMSETAMVERSKYHPTFGGFIDALKKADDSLKLSPKIVGVSAYRGYYSDIALCTKSGQHAYKEAMDWDNFPDDLDEWEEKNRVVISFKGTPKELAEQLESLIGLYFDGYKGGSNEITREKPLWIADDYGDCSNKAIMGIMDDLKLVTKQFDL